METLLKFAHEAVMFVAVAVSIGGPTIVFLLAKTDNVPALRAVFGMFVPMARMIAPLYGVGTVLGLLTVWAMDLAWLSTWLVATYVLTIAAAIMGRVTEAWAAKVLALAKASPDTASAELKTALAQKAPRVIRTIDMVLILVFVALMVFRPNLW